MTFVQYTSVGKSVVEDWWTYEDVINVATL